MKRMTFVGATACCLANMALAAPDDFVGSWMIYLQEGRVTSNGHLQIEATDSGYRAWVEGGPVARLSMQGNDIAFAIDDWGRAGGWLERFLTGSLEGDRIVGTFGPENTPSEEDLLLCKMSAANCPHPQGSWWAEPWQAIDTSGLAPEPWDITGRWGTSHTGSRRWTRDTTANAETWLADYDVRMDLPRQRCVSSGLWMTWGAMEILAGSDPNTLVGLFGYEIRRIYFDDREPGEDSDPKPLGFSRGHWEGDTLVITTDLLLPGVLNFNGNPIGENAVMVERLTPNQDRTELTATLTLYDPDNYSRPPVQRQTWRLSGANTRVQFPLTCDPDSFYRELWLDGGMEEYWQRSDRRF